MPGGKKAASDPRHQHCSEMLVTDTRRRHRITPIGGRILLDTEVLQSRGVGVLEDLGVVDVTIANGDEHCFGHPRSLVRCRRQAVQLRDVLDMPEGESSGMLLEELNWILPSHRGPADVHLKDDEL